MSTWITRLDASGDGPRLAVKDAIDVAGVPTTVGCAAVADVAQPAEADAACVATARRSGARVVGKANLHELCFGTSGENRWFGSPVNPLDPTRVPGGSSSGSAVAVANDEADVAYGTDTGGSVRIPAACCGITGLKTTWGRVPLDGVWPLAPSLDTVGPLARDVAGVVVGMGLLEAGFAAAIDAATIVGRVRVAGVDPAIDRAVDEALRAADLDTREVELAGWDAAQAAFAAIILSEAWAADGALVQASPERVGAEVRDRLTLGSEFEAAAVLDARAMQVSWTREVDAQLRDVEVLALPTIDTFAPRTGERVMLNRLTGPFNLSGHPAIALPVPAGGSLPASLQLVASWGREDLLCATASRLEAAAASI